MEGHRVKTAFELAMDKVAEMPKLNAEEIREELKKESFAKGEAIARNYLRSIHRKLDIHGQLSALDPQQKAFAQKSALKCLSQELSLTHPETNRHTLDGIAILNPDISAESALKQLNHIIDRFQKELTIAYAAIEKSEGGRLKREGISGSAVKPNLKTLSVWLTKKAEVAATHTGKLYELQQTLLPD